RAESSAELDPVIHVVLLAFDSVAAKDFGYEGKNATQALEPTHVKHAEIQRHKNGLMRIDHDGVGQLPAFGYPSVFRHHGEPAAVSGVDVQPHFFLPANLRDLWNGVDTCGRSRSNGCDDRNRLKPVLPIVRDTAA